MRSIPSVEGNALTRTPQSAEHPRLPESSSFWFFFSSIKEKKNAESAMQRERLPHFSVSWSECDSPFFG
jgi:hypothetical protein